MSPATTAAVWRAGRARRRAGRPPVQREQPAVTDRLIEGIEQGIRKLAAEDLPHVWEALTDHGRDVFVREVAVAFANAAPEDRVLAVGEVVEAWERTWLTMQTPGYAEARAKADRAAEGKDLGERAYTIDELRERLGLPPG